MNAKQTLIISALETAKMLQMHFSEFLKTPESGIYSVATDALLLPLDHDGNVQAKAFWLETQKVEIISEGLTQEDATWLRQRGMGGLAGATVYQQQPVLKIGAIKDIVQPIVDQDHNELITWDDIKGGLDYRPSQMNLMLRLVEAFIHEQCEQYLKFVAKREKRFSRMLYEVLDPQHRKFEIRAEIENMLCDVADRCCEFIADDGWLMHLIQRVGYDILIQKSTDFRIYDWEQRMKSGEWKLNG